MELQALLSASYLDILFDNRNKQYGGYELRKHYNQRVRNAMLIVLGSCVTLSVFMSIHSKSSTIVTHPPIEVSPIHIDPPPVHKIVIPPPVAPPAQPHTNTIAFHPPKIVDDHDIIEKSAPTVTELTHSTPGLSTSNNNDPNSLNPDIVSTHSGTTNVIAKAADKPMVWVPQMPEFNGDIQSYISSNIHYPDAARENNIDGKVTIQFVVNEDGSVSNAKILKGIGGGCDEEAIRIVSCMPRWKPGKQNGKTVKVYFTLPINFQLK